LNLPERMADHWWWRPGWAVGRRFYTWHLTFERAPALHELAAAYRAGLAEVPGLDLVPDRWLHLTMQGLGFTDEVDQGDVEAIAAAAGKQLAAVEPFELVLHRPTVTPEAIRWDPDSPGPAAVRDAIRAAIGEVWPQVPEPAGGFGAHVSIAYSNTAGPAGPVRAALDQVHAPPATARIEMAELIELNRDRRMYEWTTRACVRLGPQ
jgi:2'-5' RNA ligase